MKYFTMQECTYSSTAAARDIDNTPSPEIEAHIVESVEMLLDPLREAWDNYCNLNNLGKGGGNQHIFRLPMPGTECSSRRFIHLGAPLRLCFRPCANQPTNADIQTFLPRVACQTCLRSADF